MQQAFTQQLCPTGGCPLLYLGTQVVVKSWESPIFWILSLMGSSGDSSRLPSSLKCFLPCWQGGISLFAILSTCSAYGIEVSPGGMHKGNSFWPLESGSGCTWVCSPSFSPSQCGCCFFFYLLLNAIQGPSSVPHPQPLFFQASLLTAFYSWLQLFQWWGKCFFCLTSLQIQGPASSHF